MVNPRDVMERCLQAEKIRLISSKAVLTSGPAARVSVTRVGVPRSANATLAFVSPRGLNFLARVTHPPQVLPPPRLDLCTDQPVGKLESDRAFALSCPFEIAPAPPPQSISTAEETKTPMATRRMLRLVRESTSGDDNPLVRLGEIREEKPCRSAYARLG